MSEAMRIEEEEAYEAGLDAQVKGAFALLALDAGSP